MKQVIAIDGPAGSGKGTVAKIIAEKLSFSYLDSGAIFRTLTLAFYEKFHEVPKEPDFDFLKAIDVEIREQEGNIHYYLNGEDVSLDIYENHISVLTPKLAIHREVIDRVKYLSRHFAEHVDLVTDGRNTASAIFPNAILKVYLDASLDIRAERRHKQLLEKGSDIDVETLKREIHERDEQDTHRDMDPLVRTDDAMYIDGSYLTIDETVEKILQKYLSITSHT